MKKFLIGIVALAAIACNNNKTSEKSMAESNITETAFGVLASGDSVKLFTLKNANGMEVAISDLGGTIIK